jgi:acyl-CoA thioester hydrolase
MYEKRIEIRWRDLDAYRHVNNAVYLTYLEEVRDEWLYALFGDDAFGDFVLAHVSIDFRRELTQADDQVLVSCSLAKVGTSSIRTREEIRILDGTLAAEAEAVLVARNLERGGSRPFTREEREILERELQAGP